MQEHYDAVLSYADMLRSTANLLTSVTNCEQLMLNKHNNIPPIFHQFKLEIFRSLNSLADLLQMIASNNNTDFDYYMQSHEEIIESINKLAPEMSIYLDKYLKE